ncbi:hypothetical protein ACIRP2_17810 [Streptomyces sp. NPDC101194]|uniref:hypothetical protein n=1 Tax=Streptomyces sp. NPDC101194 TaxID=3366127 RepID=UPI0038068DF3
MADSLHQILPTREELPDSSSLSEIVVAKDRKRADPTPVRVVGYVLHGTNSPEQDVPYQLITTNLDPAAALYHERWEIETTLNELKTHQRGPAQVLRSRTADGVEQGVWGHLLFRYTIRSLMYDTADAAQLDADRIFFTRSLRLARRQVTVQAAFSSGRLATALAGGLQEISRHLLPACRRCFNPRASNRKMSGFGVKRDEHRHSPQPARSPARVVAIAPYWRKALATHQRRSHEAGARSLKPLVLRLISDAAATTVSRPLPSAVLTHLSAFAHPGRTRVRAWKRDGVMGPVHTRGKLTSAENDLEMGSQCFLSVRHLLLLQ